MSDGPYSQPPIDESKAPPAPASQNYLGDFKTKEEAEAGFASLREELDGIKSTLAETEKARSKDRQTIDSLIVGQAGGSSGPPEPQALPELPNPAEDPTGYSQAFEERKRIEAQNAAALQEYNANRQASLNGIWGDFREENPDLFGDNELITSGILREEVDKIAKTGVDPTDYILRDPEGVKDRVKKRATDYLTKRKLIGSSGEGEGEGEGEGSDDGNDVNRASGIPGGGRAAASSSSDKGGQQQGSTLAAELKDVQRTSGFF